MSDRRLLGMLTPSSNTVLEPMTTAMLDGLPEVSAHFGRFRVTEISLGAGALGQFDQVDGVLEVRFDGRDGVDLIGKVLALAHQPLGTGRIVPEVGILDGRVQLIKALGGLVPVKDASSGA